MKTTGGSGGRKQQTQNGAVNSHRSDNEMPNPARHLERLDEWRDCLGNLPAE